MDAQQTSKATRYQRIRVPSTGYLYRAMKGHRADVNVNIRYHGYRVPVQ